jgi:hypothetical protein
VSLKSDIEQKLGYSVKLRAGMPGSLDIYADGERIYSKGKSSKLPQAGDILPLLEARRAG